MAQMILDIRRILDIEAPDHALIFATEEAGTSWWEVLEAGKRVEFMGMSPCQLPDGADFLVLPIGHCLDRDDTTDPPTLRVFPPEHEE
jgi:hypothetical protein